MVEVGIDNDIDAREKVQEIKKTFRNRTIFPKPLRIVAFKDRLERLHSVFRKLNMQESDLRERLFHRRQSEITLGAFRVSLLRRLNNFCTSLG